MGTKILRYCIVESEFRFRFILLVVLLSALFAQAWYRGVQTERLKTFQAEKALVDRVGDMEEMLRTRAKLEAIRKQDDGTLADVRPTKISGIAMQQGVPSVLIDGTVYSEGSTFGDYVIVKITKEMITLINKETKAIKNLYVFE